MARLSLVYRPYITADGIRALDTSSTSTLVVCSLSTRLYFIIEYESNINIFWALAIQTSWYLLPVYQFVALSRGWIHILGDTNECYDDYRCAKPYAFVSLEIHVPSLHNILNNGPYILFGICYMILVFIRKCYRNQNTPMLISLRASLMMEGIFSAIYHVCASSKKFQFDTTFMYTMLLLHITVLLYSNSSISPTQNNNSLSERVGALQLSKPQQHREFSQLPMFAALILISWLVLLNENLKKSSQRNIIFCYHVCGLCVLISAINNDCIYIACAIHVSKRLCT